MKNAFLLSNTLIERIKLLLTMKYLSFIFLLVVAACSYPESPRPVAEQFLAALQNGDYDEASKYGTKETAKLLRQLKRMEELSHEKMEVSKGKITITSEEIDGDKATIYFKEEGSEAEQRLTLQKTILDEKKQWRVVLSKHELKIPTPLNNPALPDSAVMMSF